MAEYAKQNLYQAPNKDLAELNLDKLQDKWGKKIPCCLGIMATKLG